MIEEEQQEAQFIGPGQILQSARVAAKLSTKEIAKKLHLKASLIEDLEADSCDENISVTFVKGYLKLYAKQVKVSEETVLEAFDKLNTKKKEPAKLQSFSRRVANQANDDKLMMVTYLILAVVLALVVVWWFQQSDNDNTVKVPVVPEQIEPEQDTHISSINELSVDVDKVVLQTESEAATNVDEVEKLVADGELSAQVQQNDIPATSLIEGQSDVETDAAAESVDELVSEPVLLAAEEVVPVATAVELAEPVELIFEFAADCWMNLQDATGENIAYGIKKAGRVMPVTGIPPFVVTLGAPEVVQISYAEQVVDMSVFKPGNTAKFTLPITQ
jgi:cytoskeleton protein RodZ